MSNDKIEAIVDTVLIQDVKVSAYTIPTDHPEADGTIEWDSTTMILVEIHAGGEIGIGYTYAHIAVWQRWIHLVFKPGTGRAIRRLGR